MRYHYAPGSDAAHVADVAAAACPPAPAGPPVRVLASARPYDPATPGTPAAVAGLAALAAAATPPLDARVTFALAEDAGSGELIASLAVRVPAVGCAVYTRRVRETSSGWTAAGVVLWTAPRGLRVAGVNELKAALVGVPYVPPPPRPPPFKVPCQGGCGVWAPITGDGRIYASHKCKTTTGTEGRS